MKSRLCSLAAIVPALSTDAHAYLQAILDVLDEHPGAWSYRRVTAPSGRVAGRRAGTADGVREFQSTVGLPVNGLIDAATWQRLRALPDLSADIPTRAVAFIGREEVGSRKLYEIQCIRPTWPGGASGVTIGVGYDLGYQSNFDADWSDLLTASQAAALRRWLGVKGQAARASLEQLADVTIPWHAAWTAFIRRTLPQEVDATRKTFARSAEMPRLCLGVLVSLVYNRGTSMADPPGFPNSRKEMRDIRNAVEAGRLTDMERRRDLGGRSWRRQFDPRAGAPSRRSAIALSHARAEI